MNKGSWKQVGIWLPLQGVLILVMWNLCGYAVSVGWAFNGLANVLTSTRVVLVIKVVSGIMIVFCKC